MTLSAGTRLGPYAIVSPIGAGGMGEVYLARDQKLERDVAVKLVPAELQANPDAVERFHREARAVAALNHPNIVTIYGVDEADGRAFLAMELIDGTTLGDRIPRGGLPLDEVLKIAIPLADALAAAHEQGVAHRDLKPANIMIARDGRVKVLDFGLAKLRADAADVGATRTAADLTGEGNIVGTVAYMSPEQASGEPVDTRTDLFSLGILLYEMATGQRPFAGDSGVKVLAAILKDTPTPITEVRPGLPRELARIVRRALAKDPEERYQTAKDLRNDLRALRADLTSGELSAPDVAPAARGGSRMPWLALAAAAVVVGALVAYALWSRPAPDTAPQQALAQTRLTTTGLADAPAVSRDGRLVAFITRDGGHGVRVRQVATQSEAQLVPPAAGSILGVTISPDGEYVYFVRSESSIGVLYRSPVLGGVPERLVYDVDTAVTFSPDGARVAFLRGVKATAEIHVVIVAADGTGEETVTTATGLGGISFEADPAWSPDGRVIAVSLSRGAGLMMRKSGESERIGLVDAATGDIRELDGHGWWAVTGLAWMSSGALVASATEPGRPNSQLWRIAIDDDQDGTVERLTSDLSNFEHVSIAADTGAILTTVGTASSTLSILRPGEQTLEPLTTGPGRFDGRSGLTWTHDGRVIYSSAASGGQVDLWISDADGDNLRRLTSDDEVESFPAVSPDDTFLVYKAGLARGLARLPLQGGASTTLTTDVTDTVPSVLSDGATVQFFRVVQSADRVRTAEVRRVSATGGDTAVTLALDSPPFVSSADGRYVVGYVDWVLTLLPTDGSEPEESFPILNVPFGIALTPAEDAITFLRGSRSLWNQPLAGGDQELVLDLGSDRIYDFAWSAEGTLAVAHGPTPTDIVMITGAR